MKDALFWVNVWLFLIQLGACSVAGDIDSISSTLMRMSFEMEKLKCK